MNKYTRDLIMIDCVNKSYVNENLLLLKKLTLVIPTYNRNYYLSRCLWYHAHFPFGEIIVADSSQDGKKQVNREIVAKVSKIFGSNIRYLEYKSETDKNGGDIYRKWGDAVQHVDTEYSQICTDKEFLIPQSLQKCIEYLESHKDYISCGGREYQLYCKNNLKNRAEYYLIQGDSSRTSEMGINNLERYTHAFLEVAPMHNSLLLQMMRAEAHKYSYQKLLEYDINNIKYNEILLGYINYFFGKYYCLDNDIYVIRDNRGIQQDKRKKYRTKSMESSASRYQDVYMNHEDTSIYYRKFEFYLLDMLTSIGKMDRKDAELLINTTIKDRVFACNDVPTIRSKIASRLPIALDIWYCMPHDIQNISNKFTKKIFNFTLPTDIIKNFDESHKDVNIITQIIVETTNLQSQDEPVPISRLYHPYQ